MVYRTEKHGERAQEHLDSGVSTRLPYACLELRYAIERIAYQKLQLRLDHTTPEQIASWQPERVIRRLMELVDDQIDQNFILRYANLPADGSRPRDQDYRQLGSHKGIDPRLIGKYWHLLGSHLHVMMPRKKGDHTRDPERSISREKLTEILSYINEIEASGFDVHLNLPVKFECASCGQLVVRNSQTLNHGDNLDCQTPNCTASYIVHKVGEKFQEQFEFERRTLDLEFLKCGHVQVYDPREVLGLELGKPHELKCKIPGCNATQWVVWQLNRFTNTPPRKTVSEPGS